SQGSRRTTTTAPRRPSGACVARRSRPHGAVSEECAGEMAAGARKVFGADVAASTTDRRSGRRNTGEAGRLRLLQPRHGRRRPDLQYQLWGTRYWVKLLASQVALDMVRRAALGLPAWDPSLFRRG